MLRLRVITALVLVGIFFPCLLWPSPVPLSVLVTALILAAAWEWARLCGWRGRSAITVTLPFVCGAIGWTFLVPTGLVEPAAWVLAMVFWVCCGLAMLAGAGAVAGWARLPAWLRVLVGWLILGVVWLALLQARRVGINFLLSSMALVWAADISAYFAGRAFGTRWIRQRLAPAISPAKSWEGLLGGVAGVWLVGYGWVSLDREIPAMGPSLFTDLWLAGGVPFALGLSGLVLMAAVGDLFESLVKRSAGVKDSSSLLPGHGGVLDRVDALLPVLPLAVLLRGALVA